MPVRSYPEARARLRKSLRSWQPAASRSPATRLRWVSFCNRCSSSRHGAWMAELTSPQFWLAVVAIIFVNILLSGDNAVVIALACRNLSPRARRYGIFWGVLGAIVLRIVMTFFVMRLLVFPWLKLVGAVLLVWIGIRLIAEDAGDARQVEASDRLLTAIGTILVADLVMSFDNVMAVAAAAKGDVWLIVFGLSISIPIVVMGS